MFEVPKIFQRSRGRYDFENATGRESKIQIKSKELIGAGAKGDIYRARVGVLGERGRTREDTFVLKDFQKIEYGKPRALKERKELIEKAMTVHAKLKELGIRTWATYRNEDSWRYILMTDGGSEHGHQVISCNNTSQSESRMRGFINGFYNFDTAIETAAQDAIKAADKGIGIPADTWMGRIHRMGPGPAGIEIFAGDFDSVEIDLSKEKEPRPLASVNLQELRSATLIMVQKVLIGESGETMRTYADKVDATFAKFSSSMGKSNIAA